MKIRFIGVCLLVLNTALSQVNLVPNYSFETNSICPTSYGEVSDANLWNKCMENNISPHHCDYFNSCSSGMFSTPANTWGTETPATGQAYMGMCTMATPVGPDYRENIYTQLTAALIVGATYSVSMKVSLADNFMLASNKLGIKFSTNTAFPINNVSHVYASNPLANQNGWTTISGIFVADSAYNYIGVGNFFDDAHTTETLVCSTCSQYYNLYFIDDVSVIRILSNPDGISETNIAEVLSIFPNPSTGFFTISGYNFKYPEISVFNSLGEKVSFTLVGDNIDLGSAPSGIYMLDMQTGSRRIIKRIVVQR